MINSGTTSVDRRTVVKGALSSLIIPFSFEFSTRPAMASGGAMVNSYLMISPDPADNGKDIVTVYIGSTEMGQGIMTGMALLVAEELQLDWNQVRVEHGNPAIAGAANPYRNQLFHMQLTGGSTSTMGWYLPVRQAAAEAREKLLSAARAWNGSMTWSLSGNGYLLGDSTTYQMSYFAADAANVVLGSAPTLATTKNFIGKGTFKRVDVLEKTRGSAVFGIDVVVPEMVYASVAHAPAIGGTVDGASVPASYPGALGVYNLGNAVGVIANDSWTAMRLANSVASQVRWIAPASLPLVDSAAVKSAGASLLTSASVTTHEYENVGSSPLTAIGASTYKIDATYNLPFLAHACMEVLNCTVSVPGDGTCEMWVPTQAQDWCLATASAMTGISDLTKIKINTTYLGGGFGRKIEQDYVVQALTMAISYGKPVKLIWSRSQDFRNDKYRPSAAIRVRMGVNSSGPITGMQYRNVSPSINIQRNSTPGNNPEDTGAVAGATSLPYAITNRIVEFVPNPTDIPLGYWRSVGESYNTFAVESAIDELAVAARKDPLAFRKSLLANDSRALGVMSAVETMSSWATKPPSGSARGVAFLKGFGSYVALVVQISGKAPLRVTKAFCAIDCGVAVNPDAIEAQMQGGIAHGISATLWNQMQFVNGVPQVSNFDRYRVTKMADMPAVTVRVISSDANPGGVGEAGVPCVAPAIANAYAKLTGTRVRNLPFYPGSTMGEIG